MLVESPRALLPVDAYRGDQWFDREQDRRFAERCSVIDLRIRAEPGADADALLEALHSFIVEDIAACEAIQQATGSPAFALGPLAQDHERPISIFHRNLLAAMDAP
jgi:predicted mannosyl-3-phosphoglycerate phosphatase (HAD superfamily)